MKVDETTTARSRFSESQSERLATVLGAILLCILGAQVVLGYSLVSWNVSEWLINYDGGFVRRGLPGSIILHVSRTTGTSPYWWAIGTSLAALVVAIGVLARRSRGHLRGYILCSPALFGGAILGDFWFRKDVIGVVSLLLCLQVLFGKWNSRRRLPRLVAANLVCILMLLSHEAYGFYALPILVLANAAERAISVRDNGSLRALCISTLEFSVSVVTFLIVVAFNGSEALALEIHRSWSGLYFPYDAWTPYPELPAAAIEGIGWTTRAGVGLVLAEWTKFSGGIYVPLAWIATVYLSAGFLVGSLRSTDDWEPSQPDSMLSGDLLDTDARGRKRFVRVLVLQLLTISPLFILGCDYGRWIFLWGSSAVVIYLCAPGPVLDALPGTNILSRFEGISGRLVTPHPALLLLFGIPAVEWTVGRYVWSTPLGGIFAILKRLLLTLGP